MRSLLDALYNWLTIKIVSDERPDDTAAAETKNLFERILKEDHGIGDIEIKKDDVMYTLHYRKDEEWKKTSFPCELIEVMINQINEEPEKYPNYPK
ncbi:hypothetical protein PB1_01850 [Bacillus methanolicus PB1]|uniref:Uncharacterized protein n=1 Tax=Bacillus methanolicus PB1 TaxID=997296 RepID=I3E574_BACMT|nr:hypothetical protein [Bacillus methanolicus]EIJ81645.1 hypothetical protein PB1_01850 [Bacillus methanolicus PB1]